VVQSAHQPDVGAEKETGIEQEIADEAKTLKEVDDEVKTSAESLEATGPGLAHHSRYHRTRCEMATLAALSGVPAVEESACAGPTGVVAVAGSAAVGNAVFVAGKVVDVQASGGDSRPARGRLDCHIRRTSNCCLQGLQGEQKRNSSVMQVAEAENSNA
jgi:hypothetical protein